MKHQNNLIDTERNNNKNMDIETFKKLKEDYKKAVKTEGKKLFKEQFKKLFDDVPNLRKVSWVQYTPYFNDGDACVFGVQDFQYYTIENSLLASGDEDVELVDESYGCEAETFNPKRKHFPKSAWASKELYNKFTEFEKMSFDEDVFREIFGEGKIDVFREIFGEGKIVAVRTESGDVEFTVSDYEHE